MDHITDTAQAVVILVPNRVLRDELVESPDCMGEYVANKDGVSQRALWLGRPATEGNHTTPWELELMNRVKEKQSVALEELHDIGKSMLALHGDLLGVDWLNSCRDGCFRGTDRALKALASFKDTARVHMAKVMLDIKHPRAAIVRQLIQKINIVVSTCDAWGKWRAGCIGGYMGQALDRLKLVLFIMDEMEGYYIEQFID